LGIEARWGVAGLTVSASLAGWVEFALLRHTLNRRIGPTGLPLSLAVKLCSAAVTGGAAAWLVKLVVGLHHPILAAGLVLSAYGLVYVSITYGWGIPEAQAIAGRLVRVIPRFRR
jgi:putative peptidoglycan lipid II flippase